MANKKISQLTERTVLETTDVIPVVASGGIETNKTLLSTLLAWIQTNLIGKFNTPTGTASQYIRGDGQLAAFPTSTGGGSSVAYYLNGGVDSNVIGYKQMSKTAVTDLSANFILNADGVIAEFMTDAGDPNLVEIKAGNWNFELYFNASSAGGTPMYYISLLKFDGSTYTPIASSISAPKPITSGTNIDLYVSALAIPLTTLSVTDRLVVRVNVIHDGRTLILWTQNGHLCEIITNFASGVSSINGVTKQTQYLAVGQGGSDFNIDSQDASGTHYFNLPTASSVNRGALSAADWNLFYSKQSALGFTPVTEGRTITINGVTYDLSANRSWTVDTGSANFLSGNPLLSYGLNGLNYFSASGTVGNSPTINSVPTNNWYHIIRMNHPNVTGYYVDVAYGLNTSDVWYRRITNGIANGWYRIIDSLNIESQNVAYANNAGVADETNFAYTWYGLDGYQISYAEPYSDGIDSLYGYNDNEGVPTKFDSDAVRSWLSLGSAALFNAAISAIGNTVVQRNTNGYIYATYLNNTNTDVNFTTPASLNGENGADGFIRKYSADAVKTFLGLTNAVSSSAMSGYIPKIDGLNSFQSGGTAGVPGGTLIPNRTTQQGVVFMQTSILATNYINYCSCQGSAQFYFGNGAWNYETSFNINNLSTGSERYRLIFGYGAGSGSTSEGDGVFFTYDEGGTANGTAASPNWQCVTVQSSTRTLTTTSTAVVTATWLKLRIEINATGTSAAFYLNGTLLATHTTNIPLGSNNRFVLVKQGIAKTIGIASRGLYVDYIGYENILTTPRT